MRDERHEPAPCTAFHARELLVLTEMGRVLREEELRIFRTLAIAILDVFAKSTPPTPGRKAIVVS